MSESIFDKIIRREIPAEILFEDSETLAFKDIHPAAPIHILIIPKKRIHRIAESTEADQMLLGGLLLTAQRVAETLGLDKIGYRLVINNGRDGGESVPHLHLHLLGGRPLSWPPG